MHDIRIREVAHDLTDGVAGTDVGQKLVAKALSLTGALDQARDVNELDRRRYDARRAHDIGKPLQAIVRHVHDAHIGIDSRKGIVGRKTTLFGKCRKQGRLAHVGQPHDTDGKRHAIISVVVKRLTVRLRQHCDEASSNPLVVSHAFSRRSHAPLRSVPCQNALRPSPPPP